VRNYYEMLSIEPSADASTIKTAFRREIARYHPDKVIHLGPEFQEMAAARAAELTVAYKTLSDAALRAEYDTRLAEGVHSPPKMPSAEPPVEPAPEPPPPPEQAQQQEEEKPRYKTPVPAAAGRSRFESERAGRDVIIRRAVAVRVQAVLEALYGKMDTPTVRGFDIAFVPTAKPRMLSAPLPRVLVKVVETVDAAVLSEAWTNASRARIHQGKSPVVVLLFGKHLAGAPELTRALQNFERQPKTPDRPHELAVVAVDAGNWDCRLPPGASAPVKKLIEHICK
jgi:hypothetical protein